MLHSSVLSTDGTPGTLTPPLQLPVPHPRSLAPRLLILMQRTCLWPMLAAALLLALPPGVASISAQSPHVPSYVEASNGLHLPGMENGRTELVFGDVNGDGHPDMVSVGDHGSPFINSDQHGVMVWFGDGTGNWTLHMEGLFGYGGVALGDVNNDGLMDVGYGIHHNYSGTDFGDQLLEVALGDGTGMNWTPWDDGLATSGETWGMFGTDFADIDNDGHLDVGSISFGCCAGVHVYRNNSDGTWTRTFGFLGGNSDMIFVFGDINGDGHSDFAAGHGDGTVYLGDGEGGFTPADANLPGPSWRSGVSLGDVTGDGRDELAFTTSGGVAVYRWVDGLWEDLSGDLATIGPDYRFTQIADMNNDGYGDMVTLSKDNTRVYLGDGAGNWTLAASTPTDSACRVLALTAGSDIDHSGYADLAYVAEEDCHWWIGGTNELHLFREGSTPDTPWVHPVYPRGGEVFIAGSVRFIDWHAAIPADVQPLPPMTIELSTTGPDGPWTVIADSVPCNGRHQWIVPPGITPSEDCRLRFRLGTDPEAIAVTPGSFSIRQGGPASVDPTGPGPRAVPATAEIRAAAPNPFHPHTVLHLHMDAPGEASLAVYDPGGRLVRSLLDCRLNRGGHKVGWDGRTNSGVDAVAGTYLVRLSVDGQPASKAKVTLTR